MLHSRPHRVIADATLRFRAARADLFDNRLPFAWMRWVRAAISYALLFSDVPRSGLGMYDLGAAHPMLEPDVLEFYGPWNYSVLQLWRNSTDDTMAARVWSYKFDTTSIIWRALAQHLNISTFPPCLLYKTDCASDMMGAATTFSMVDSVPTALTTYGAHQRRHDLEPSVLSLRSVHIFRDRLHHFILPSIFVNPLWRTNQAIYYPAQLVSDPLFVICRGPKPRPLACSEMWINFDRSCPRANPDCRATGVIWKHIVTRTRELQARFPDHLVDLTLLESSEDAQVSQGGLSAMSRRSVDISTILRARKCINDTSNVTSCETTFLEDYRYEGGVFTTNVVEWFKVVAPLRLLGQVYFMVRVCLLMVSCYVTRAAEEACQQLSTVDKMHAARRLFVRLPSQVVIYGSPLPIVCYAIAHLMDAPFTCVSTAEHFTTSVGVFTLNFKVFFITAAVQMRNIWFLAIMLHLVVWTSAAREWSPSDGVLGAPPFVLSVLSSLTVFSHWRAISFRNTELLAVFPLVGAPRRLMAIRNHSTSARRGAGTALLEGTILDLKMLGCLITLTLLVRLIWWSGDVIRPPGYRPSIQGLRPGHTPVPLCARQLWPAVSVSVQWRGTMFKTNTKEASRTGSWRPRVEQVGCLKGLHRWRRRRVANVKVDNNTTVPAALVAWGSSSETAAPQSSTTTHPHFLGGPGHRFHLRAHALGMGWFSDWPVDATSDDTLRFVRFHMEHALVRCSEVDAIVALMNLVFMSDPLVLWKVKGSRGVSVAYYQSTMEPTKVLLLPETAAHEFFEQDDLVLLRQTTTIELEWSDLIHCG
ncbi:TPA: hypothetical protein N0F65_011829 [Lagenidium giganteum]|uniref:Uncharacterized protein n=1 Tax=Lagenidium giganteum TaxID=4803 RepID=A0AAV2Z346_9STRA|nr:TPA: hypothetical protein N0F65_011829 [Lagenidium giganteum]